VIHTSKLQGPLAQGMSQQNFDAVADSYYAAHFAMLQCSKKLPIIMLIIMLETVPMFCHFLMYNDKIWLMKNCLNVQNACCV